MAAAQGQKRPAEEQPAGPKPPIAKVAKAGIPKLPPGGKAPLAKLPSGSVGKAPLAKVPPGGGKAALAKVPTGGGKAALAKVPVGGKAAVPKVPSGGTADVAKVPAGGKTAMAKVPGGGKAVVAKIAKAPPKAAVAKVAPARALIEDEADEQASAPETAPPAPATPPENPAPVVPAPATPPAGDEFEDEEVDEKKKENANYEKFAQDDPLYALMGEAGENKVFDKEENFRPELMDRYLERTFVHKAVRRPKDWVELWAAMDIPVDKQAMVIAPILRYGLKVNAQDLGAILACLLLGHRTKTKAIGEAVLETMSGIKDPSGILREFLYRIFPRGENSKWGWSRIGWSWQEWWKIASLTIGCLEPMSAFDELALLLDRIETEGGEPFTNQQNWTDKRLEKCRNMLMESGGLETEADLWACIDVSLKR